MTETAGGGAHAAAATSATDHAARRTSAIGDAPEVLESHVGGRTDAGAAGATRKRGTTKGSGESPEVAPSLLPDLHAGIKTWPRHPTSWMAAYDLATRSLAHAPRPGRAHAPTPGPGPAASPEAARPLAPLVVLLKHWSRFIGSS